VLEQRAHEHQLAVDTGLKEKARAEGLPPNFDRLVHVDAGGEERQQFRQPPDRRQVGAP